MTRGINMIETDKHILKNNDTVKRLFIIRFLIIISICFYSCRLFSQEYVGDDVLKKYVDLFNEYDNELYIQNIPNDKAFSFLKKNIPYFECPDKNVELTYYFRWWTYRKHIKKTPVGYIITEFLPDVSWSAEYNAITCPGLFHFLEGRWMRNTEILSDYANFWLYHSGYPKMKQWKHFKAVLGHGFPLSDAIFQFYKVHPSVKLLKDNIDELINNYETLKSLRKTDTGLYWSNAGGWEGDGMEVAVGGNGIRPTINSYMYSQANAISEICRILGDDSKSEHYRNDADTIKNLINTLLWDDKTDFFKVVKRETHKKVDVRELFGYVPWCYCIPPMDGSYSKAWSQVMDSKGFYAPYGLTTCEQRHKGFKIVYQGHDCQWNGPSWPYATSQTLMAMANLLQEYSQDVVSKYDYLTQFLIYTNSHKLHKDNGDVVPWIDENLNPYTGDWIARTMLSRKKEFNERGKDYNHSSYVDLLITGIIGLKPRVDNVIEINPCLPENAWDYFCLENIPYKEGNLSVIWDKDGTKYNNMSGLTVKFNGSVIYNGKHLEKVKISL